MSDHAVIWHDLECHGYAADLPLWRAIAAAADGPVLEVGAGTGRVSLDLAAAGFTVTALDNDDALLAELRARAQRRGLSVTTVCADATALTVASATDTVAAPTLSGFGAVIVPMQTVQILGDRGAFLAAARAALRPGATLALAISEDLEPFEGDGDWLPEPDFGTSGGWEFTSQPTAIRVNGTTATIERVRAATAPDGTTTRTTAAVVLTTLTREQLEAEAATHGFATLPSRAIAPTADHVGSTVVMLRA